MKGILGKGEQADGKTYHGTSVMGESTKGKIISCCVVRIEQIGGNSPTPRARGNIVMPLERPLPVLVMPVEGQSQGMGDICVEHLEGVEMTLKIKVGEGKLDVTEGDKLEIDNGSANEEVEDKEEVNAIGVVIIADNVVDEGEDGAGISIGNDRNDESNANDLDDEGNAKDANDDSGSEVDELDNVDAERKVIGKVIDAILEGKRKELCLRWNLQVIVKM